MENARAWQDMLSLHDHSVTTRTKRWPHATHSWTALAIHRHIDSRTNFLFCGHCQKPMQSTQTKCLSLQSSNQNGCAFPYQHADVRVQHAGGCAFLHIYIYINIYIYIYTIGSTRTNLERRDKEDPIIYIYIYRPATKLNLKTCFICIVIFLCPIGSRLAIPKPNHNRSPHQKTMHNAQDYYHFHGFGSAQEGGGRLAPEP